LITVSNKARLFGGSLRPPPIATQSYSVCCAVSSMVRPTASGVIRRQSRVGEVDGFRRLANE
jgi:hypothetical protein